MHWVLPPEMPSIPRARGLIDQWLIGLPEESRQVVLLLANELVTNAVRHGVGPVGLHLARANGSVRVDVEDDSPEWPVVQPIDRESLDGRGLVIVDAMASEWGVLARETGKTVWFTLDEV